MPITAALATALALVTLGYGNAALSRVPTTLRDFHISGTQIGDTQSEAFQDSTQCRVCHGGYDANNEPYRTWQGSLMGQAGRDPLFLAQMATANQDVANVGYFCLRCHVPMTFVSGHAYQSDGSTLDERDRDGVNCQFCHSMVDPRYQVGASPPRDANVLGALGQVPQYFGNAMFVLDPDAIRRGPRSDAEAPHEVLASPFMKQSEMCGTCHDVGNVAVTLAADGSYRYNALDTAPETENLAHQFPLERTYTEWRLSSFGQGPVDMAGRFGGAGVRFVSTCQDCHMPKSAGQACRIGPERSDLARHDFAGASSWVLDIIGRYSAGDPAVDQAALAVGKARADAMLQLAASLELRQEGPVLRARVRNEAGHKLPTGHIEGRRVWTQVRIVDAAGDLLREYGHYDAAHAELDEASTVVYEMAVGLSDAAAAATGLPAGQTTHMALADSIVKDSRIPPRGFNIASYAAAGAPAVGRSYEDGQHWDDARFWLPEGGARAEVTVYYQTATRHYIEALREANHSDHWGETLYQLWRQSGKAAPIEVTRASLALGGFRRGDFDADGDLDASDRTRFEQCLLPGIVNRDSCYAGDFDGDRDVDCGDATAYAIASGDPATPASPCGGAPATSVPLMAAPWRVLLALGLLLGAYAALRRKRST